MDPNEMNEEMQEPEGGQTPEPQWPPKRQVPGESMSTTPADASLAATSGLVTPMSTSPDEAASMAADAMQEFSQPEPKKNISQAEKKALKAVEKVRAKEAKAASKKSVTGDLNKNAAGLSRYLSFGSWPIAPRLSLIITLVVVISLAVVTLLASLNVQRSLSATVGENFQGQASSLSVLTGAYFSEKVSQLQGLASTDSIKNHLELRNNSYIGSNDSILRQIQALDEQWIGAPDNNPLVRSILSSDREVNASTFQLLDYKTTFSSHAEIFITDRYGANIASTDRTSDYYQADEGWWQSAWADGNGAVYISQPEFDESTGVTGVLLALPIFDKESGEVIGIVRSTLVLSDLFEAFSGVQFGETGHSILFDNTGSVVYEPRDMAADESSNLLPQELRDMFLISSDHYMTAVDQHGEEAIFGHALATVAKGGVATISDSGYNFEASTSEAVDNLGWPIVVRQGTGEALALVGDLTRNNILTGLGAAFVAVLVGVFVTRSMIRPLGTLSETAEELGRGNLDARADVQSADEFGVLDSAFNIMAGTLQKTVEGMEDTIQEATRNLKERAVEMEASQRVATAATERTSPEEFLNLLANLVKDQFDVYHAQIYMLDDERKNAVLAESTG
ncbi:MAG: cache domain-containing protein, partial [Chloroflexota bacterium]